MHPSYFFVVIGGKKKGDAVVRVVALRGKNRQIFTRVKRQLDKKILFCALSRE